MRKSRPCSLTPCQAHILVSDGLCFPDGSYFALGFWDQPALLSELRHSILKSLVARKCLQTLNACRLLAG